MKKNNVKKNKATPEGGLLPGIGIVFRNRRFAMKMTLQDVAEGSGITYLTISKLEKGELSNVSIQTLSKIAEALGLSLQLETK